MSIFEFKNKYLDQITGFSLALLTGLPIIRSTLIALPGFALLVPLVLICAVGFVKIYHKQTIVFRWEHLTYVYIIFLFFFYLLLSLSWNSYPVNPNEDIQKILLTLILVVGMLITFNKRALNSFLNWTIIYAVYTTCTLLYLYSTVVSLSGYGVSSYLIRSFIIAMGAIIAISKLLFDQNANKKLYFFLTFFLFFGLAISLGRAALLAAILIAIVQIAFYYRHNWPKSYSFTEYFKNKSSLLLAFSFLGVVAFVTSQIERTFSRLIRLFSGREFDTQRVDLWLQSLYGYFEAPIIGHGISSSSIVVNFNYPHNLFLQVMVDGGTIAFVLLLIICFYPIFKTYFLYRKKVFDSYHWIPAISCYLFFLINYSLAINFYDGRILIATALIMVIAFDFVSNDNS